MKNKLSRLGSVMLTLVASGLVFSANGPTEAKGAKKAAAAPAATAAPVPTSISWVHDLRSGLTAARTARRWVLVDCYTEHCGWCKKLDADVLNNPQVIGMLGNHFVWVKCDTDNPSTGVWVKDKYQPQGYPCILILDPSGAEKGRILGYKPPSTFVTIVSNIVRH